MKFIINESQYNRILSEQKVYTDEKKYNQAMKEYNEALKIYNETLKHYKHITSLKNIPTEWCDKTENYNSFTKLAKQDEFYLLWEKSEKFKLKVKNKITVYYCDNCKVVKDKFLSPLVVKHDKDKPFGYKGSPQGCCPDCWAMGAIFEKPIKPILNKPQVVKPQKQDVITSFTQPSNEKPTPQIPNEFLYTQDKNYVFGPGNSWIGYITKGKDDQSYKFHRLPKEMDYESAVKQSDRQWLDSQTDSQLKDYLVQKLGTTSIEIANK